MGRAWVPRRRGFFQLGAREQQLLHQGPNADGRTTLEAMAQDPIRPRRFITGTSRVTLHETMGTITYFRGVVAGGSSVA